METSVHEVETPWKLLSRQGDLFLSQRNFPFNSQSENLKISIVSIGFHYRKGLRRSEPEIKQNKNYSHCLFTLLLIREELMKV